jgi:hypothetical protein
MEAGGPLNMSMIVPIFVVGITMRLNRRFDLWFFAFLFTFPLVLAAWVGFFPRPCYGSIAVCIWFIVWYFGFARISKSITHYSADWHRQHGTKLIWWSYYTVLFLCGFSYVIISSAARVRPPMVANWLEIPTMLLFFGAFGVLAKIRPLAIVIFGGYDQIEQPYRVPCKDMNNFMAFELANSFDHPGLQMTAAINTLQSGGSRYLTELLDIEKAILSRQTAWANAVKIFCGLAAFALVITIVGDGAPILLNAVLAFFVALLIPFIAIRDWIRFIPSSQHADAIAALSYIPSSKVIPAVIRGWTTYFAGLGYDFHAERFAAALLERVKMLSPGESVALDDLTMGKLIRRLSQSYRYEAKSKPIKIEVAAALIGMPGITENPNMKRLLTKLAAGTGKNNAQSEMEYAARLALLNEQPRLCDKRDF